MDVPIGDWIFLKTKSYDRTTKNQAKASRVGGRGYSNAGINIAASSVGSSSNEQQQSNIGGAGRKNHAGAEGKATPGQVPTDPEGRRLDLIELNKVIQEVWKYAQGKNLKLAMSHPPVVTEDMLDFVIGEFRLAPCCPTSFPNPNSLLPMKHLGEIKPLLSENVAALIQQGEKNMAKNVAKCVMISQKQERRCIELTWGNLLTLFYRRWLDSVVLDAYLHVLQEHWPFKNVLYINSAEKDPSLRELKDTPTCYPYALSVLFYKNHWTVIMINHVKQQIRYLNSQVFDHRIPEKQSAPFKKAFPNYDVQNVTHAQQCNDSDCGVYSAAWMMIYLFYNDIEKQFNRISCEDMHDFRRRILWQLILYFVLLHNKEKCL